MLFEIKKPTKFVYVVKFFTEGFLSLFSQRNIRAQFKSTFFTLLVSVSFLQSANARDITIRWAHIDPNAVSNFRFYFGNSSGQYNSNRNLGVPSSSFDSSLGMFVFQATFTVPDNSIYGVLTAINSVGGESAMSNERFYSFTTPPPPPTNPPPTNPPPPPTNPPPTNPPPPPINPPPPPGGTHFQYQHAFSLLTKGHIPKLQDGRFDLNGDGKDDLMFVHINNLGKETVILASSKSNGTYNVKRFGTGHVQDLQLIGYSDFDGNNKTDLLWRHRLSGVVSIWFMGGSTGLNILNKEILSMSPGSYMLAGILDLDGDGHLDLYWKDVRKLKNKKKKKRAYFAWYLNNGVYDDGASLGLMNSRLIPVGVADADGDGDVNDMVWLRLGKKKVPKKKRKHDILSTPTHWKMPRQYSIQGLGDFNQDHYNDIVTVSGSGIQVRLSQAVGNGQRTFVEALNLTDLPTQSILQSVGDYDGDRIPDMIVFDPTTSVYTLISIDRNLNDHRTILDMDSILGSLKSTLGAGSQIFMLGF